MPTDSYWETGETAVERTSLAADKAAEEPGKSFAGTAVTGTEADNTAAPTGTAVVTDNTAVVADSTVVAADTVVEVETVVVNNNAGVALALIAAAARVVAFGPTWDDLGSLLCLLLC